MPDIARLAALSQISGITTDTLPEAALSEKYGKLSHCVKLSVFCVIEEKRVYGVLYS